ncbi:DUF3911 family protein [Bacillus thuringiensis]|nr:DUF3911 family protein [Bacillus thuringiensis]MED2757307.1 DUF3911 family protein [Bacillus thuringiensis]MED2767530.1 DUF3911 family protein [Bacillus thuringiensis]MED2777710.1 DUF3911 family protein [Bacillus thuringiensis]MED2782822.1 DUF3911 family protein [Bacillus thuringiensis]
MACVQIKGTRQEVVEMLQLFDLMDTKGFCKYVEVEPNTQEHNHFIASIDIHSNTSSAQDTLNDQFVSQMLTGVYND